MVRTRRRGTAIVDTPKGILVVSKDGGSFILPGGGANRGESEKDATILELKEETGMEAVEVDYLFDFTGMVHKDSRGSYFRNAHKVFVVTEGHPRTKAGDQAGCILRRLRAEDILLSAADHRELPVFQSLGAPDPA